MTSANISTLPTLKIDLSDHLFIKDDIFEVNLVYHQEVLLLASLHSTVNITSCRISPSQQTIDLGTVLLLQ